METGQRVLLREQLDTEARALAVRRTASAASTVAVCHGKSCSVWHLGRDHGRSACRVESRHLVLTPRPHREGRVLLCVDLAPEASLVAAGASDGELWVWNSETGAKEGNLSGHQDDVFACEFLARQVLATASADHSVRIWTKLCQGEASASLVLRHGASVLCLSQLPCEDATHLRFAAGTSDGLVHVWDLQETCWEGRKFCQINAHGQRGGVTSLATTWNGHRLVSGSLNGSIHVWNGLPLQTETAALDPMGLEAQEDQGSGYVGFSDDFLHVADGGAAVDVSCQEEFEAALLEYQQDEPAEHAQPRKLTHDREHDHEQEGAHKEGVPLSVLEEADALCRSMHHMGKCTCVCFCVNHQDRGNCEDDDALLFSAGQDRMLKVWCAESGLLLYKVQTEGVLQDLQVQQEVVEQGQHSRHLVYGCSQDGKLLLLELGGLVELQALAEYARSVETSTAEAFWQHYTRKEALRRGLSLVLGDSAETSREELVKVLEASGARAANVVDARARGHQLVHGSDADSFLRTLVGRYEAHTGRNISTALLTDPGAVCWALVSTPVKYTALLEFLSTNDDGAVLDAVGRREALLAFFDETIEVLPPCSRNHWGGDPVLGMLQGNDVRQDIFYAFESADAGGKPQSSDLADEGAVVHQITQTLSHAAAVREQLAPKAVAVQEKRSEVGEVEVPVYCDILSPMRPPTKPSSRPLSPKSAQVAAVAQTALQAESCP